MLPTTFVSVEKTLFAMVLLVDVTEYVLAVGVYVTELKDTRP